LLRISDLTAGERTAAAPDVKAQHAKIGQLAMDMTFIPLRRGVVYLAVVLDLATRRVLAWRLSNPLTADCCLDALAAAIQAYGCPAILDFDHGSQFTGTAFVGLVHQHGIQLSGDGKGAWCNNHFVERPWKSVAYEEVYLHVNKSVAEDRQGLAHCFTFYNQGRPHSALDGQNPDMVYFAQLSHLKASLRCPLQSSTSRAWFPVQPLGDIAVENGRKVGIGQ
jgi:putative transposase